MTAHSCDFCEDDMPDGSAAVLVTPPENWDGEPLEQQMCGDCLERTQEVLDPDRIRELVTRAYDDYGEAFDLEELDSP